MYSGLGAAIIHLLMLTVESQFVGAQVLYTSAIGASGAVYGILFAFGYLFPNSLVHLYFFIPVKAKYVIAGLAAIDLFGGISNVGSSNVAHFAHLGGMLTAFIIFKIWRIRYDSA
jgi:membrane associated rhomboid family serine protease